MQGELEKMKESGRGAALDARGNHGRVENEHLLANEVYVDSQELLQELKKAYPAQFRVPKRLRRQSRGGDEGPGRLIRLFLWHLSEDDPRLRSKSLGTTESFTVYIKASLLVGVCWQAPGSSTRSGISWRPDSIRTNAATFTCICLQSRPVFAGSGVGVFCGFEPVLKFLLSFNRHLGIDPEPRINEWLGFVLLLPVGFGIGFQLPLVMLFLERIGILHAGYAAQWRIAVLVIFVVAAVLTPPDPSSMLLLAGSLTLLYFGGILLCKLMPRKPGPFGASRAALVTVLQTPLIRGERTKNGDSRRGPGFPIRHRRRLQANLEGMAG